jgi:hypothetical protein
MRVMATALAVCSIVFAATACRAERLGQALTPSDMAFFADIKRAVQARDIDWVVDHVSFPLPVSEGDVRIRVADAAALRTRYDEIFDSEVTQAIGAESAERLFKNWRGIMVADGILWFEAVGLGEMPRYYIVAINKKPRS